MKKTDSYLFRSQGHIKRNRADLAIDSDIVVTYVTHNFGGASQFKDPAQRKAKRVIELSEI